VSPDAVGAAPRPRIIVQPSLASPADIRALERAVELSHMRLALATLPYVLSIATWLGASPARAETPGGGGPLADDATLIALAVSLACADAPDGTATPPRDASPSPDHPELELIATVRAKALKFDQVPHVNVAFSGSGPRRTMWKTERVNLPMHPEAGVVYRDVQVRLTVTSTVEDLGALLAQAKRAARGIHIEAAAPAAQPAPVAPAAPLAPAAPAAPAPIRSAPVPSARRPRSSSSRSSDRCSSR
jgi:hypothetical protein